MSVFHILKDGSRPIDITGHVVRLEDAQPLYRLLDSFTGKAKNSNTYDRKN